MSRELPGHIAARLNGSDSAGVPWEGRDLSGPGNPLHRFDQDDGAADPGLVQALAQLMAGTADETKIVEALSTARVFVPVLATAELGINASGQVEDKHAEMALITISAPDGRSALPIFSTVEALTSWHQEARPVAVWAPRAALAAVQEQAQLLVLDPGAELTFVVRRPAVWALAQQQTWRPSYQDPQIVDLVERLCSGTPELVRIVLAPHSGMSSRTRTGEVLAGGGVGPELAMTLTFSARAPQPLIDQALEKIQAALAADAEFATRVDSLKLQVERQEAESQ